MKNVQFKLVHNVLKAEDFIRLKVATGFIDRPLLQVEEELKNGLFNVSAICDGKVVGMGRLVYCFVNKWTIKMLCFKVFSAKIKFV